MCKRASSNPLYRFLVSRRINALPFCWVVGRVSGRTRSIVESFVVLEAYTVLSIIDYCSLQCCRVNKFSLRRLVVQLSSRVIQRSWLVRLKIVDINNPVKCWQNGAQIGCTKRVDYSGAMYLCPSPDRLASRRRTSWVSTVDGLDTKLLISWEVESCCIGVFGIGTWISGSMIVDRR